MSEASSVPSSPEPLQTCPFQVRSSEDLNRPHISYVPWTKAKLQAIVSEFAKDEDLHGFAEEFNIVIQTYQPGFSDFYQLVYMLVGEGQAKQWMKLAQWGHPEQDLKNRSLTFGKVLAHLLKNLH